MIFSEAIKELNNQTKVKFVESVDLAIRLNVNPKKPEQNVRDTCILPNPIPKSIKILVIDDSLNEKEIEELKIDHYGSNEMIEKISDGWLDFDVIITTTQMMPKILKLGKFLGPKGLMPNTKLGTVTNDIKKAVSDFKKGKTEFKNDSFGNLHVVIGKANFTPEQLIKNFEYFMNLLSSKKPSAVKGKFIKKVYVSRTMGKSIEIDL